LRPLSREHKCNATTANRPAGHTSSAHTTAQRAQPRDQLLTIAANNHGTLTEPRSIAYQRKTNATQIDIGLAYQELPQSLRLTPQTPLTTTG
jgi:hypothetical protein